MKNINVSLERVGGAMKVAINGKHYEPLSFMTKTKRGKGNIIYEYKS